MLLALTSFFAGLGQGLINAANTNFMVNVLGLSGSQVLWLTGIREIPGLVLVFIAALLARMPLSRRAALSLIVMGLGYGLHAAVRSYSALLAVAVVASLGFHNWMPLQSTLGFHLTAKAHSGRLMGFLTSAGALASIVGMGFTAWLAPSIPLGTFFVLGGALIGLGGLMVARIPTSVGEQVSARPRMIFKKRYWLYYVLTFFEGSRTQVFGAFGTLILVQRYGLDAREISLLLATSAAVNFLIAPGATAGPSRRTANSRHQLRRAGSLLRWLRHRPQCSLPVWDGHRDQPSGDAEHRAVDLRQPNRAAR